MKKNFYKILLSAVALLAFTGAAQAQTAIPDSNLSWKFSDGTLTVSGTGEMPDFDGGSPWIAHQYSITTVVIKEGVTSIGSRAFAQYEYLASVSLPETLESIGNMSFFVCKGITSITIPKAVTAIGMQAFTGCSGLTEVTVLNPTPVNITGLNVFQGITLANATLNVPAGAKTAYQNATYGWSGFGTIDEAVGTGIHTPAFPVQNIHINGNRVVIAGVENPSVSLYNITGQLLSECRANEITVPGAGVYLLKINNQVAKIMCKD